MMDTQINYSDEMMRFRRDAILSLKEFGFGKDIYEFCTDSVSYTHLTLPTTVRV